jgi:hypothetical protein
MFTGGCYSWVVILYLGTWFVVICCAFLNSVLTISY